MSELAPGDLCVVVADGLTPEIERRLCQKFDVLGKTVVLIAIDNSDVRPYQELYKPFWRCSGVKSPVTSLSHTILRKIPPAPMEQSDEDSLPLVIPTLTDAVT